MRLRISLEGELERANGDNESLKAQLDQSADELRKVVEEYILLEDDFTAKVDEKVQKSIDTMSMRLDAMNTRVKQEMEPKLAQTEGKLATLETRVGLAQGEQTELNTSVKKTMEELQKAEMAQRLAESGLKQD
mgnify:CR=1 FL=1